MGLAQNDDISIFIKTRRDIGLTNSETYLKGLLFRVNKPGETRVHVRSLTFSFIARERGPGIARTCESKHPTADIPGW